MPDQYSASDIQVLEGLDAIRKRPGMYVGSTGDEGLAHLLWEVIDNAVDEAAAGHGECIDITVRDDGSYEVSDSGRGIPVGPHPTREGLSALEVVFTELHTGAKFGGDQYKASGGLHGVGITAVNALSERVDVTVERDGKRHQLSFKSGESGHFGSDGGFKPSHKIKASGRLPKKQTGTTVRFWPDGDLMPTAVNGVPCDLIAERMRQVCYLVPKLVVTVTDERTGEKVVCGPAEGGLKDCVADLLDGESPVAPIMSFQGAGSFTEKVPVQRDGSTEIEEVARECFVEAALCWTDDDDTKIVSWVNTVPTPDGGTHNAGFEKGITSAVASAVKSAELKKLKKAETGPRRDDCLAGMVAAVRVMIPEPQFRGQTKRQLGTPEAEEVASDASKAGFQGWAEGKGTAKAHVRAVVNRVADAVLAREAAAKAAQARRRQRKLANSALPSKLSDCRSRPGGEVSPELLLVEGDSAAGPAKRARDSEWQAVLPLRGKIVNAGKSTAHQVLHNAEAQAVIAAIGAGAGKDFTLDDSRYDRIVLLADADVDGSHIRCLLITLLWHYMKPMLEEGRVFAADPPTHAIQAGKNDPEFIYGDTALVERCAELDNAGRQYRVTRFKGLGEMDDNELYECALNPATRVLRPITVGDAARAENAIKVMMGGDVQARRDYIVEHSSAYGHALDV